MSKQKVAFPNLYVIHYSKLVDRHAYLSEALKGWPGSPTWITEKNFSSFNESIPEKGFTHGISDERIARDGWINTRAQNYSRRSAFFQALILYSFDILGIKRGKLSKKWAPSPRNKLSVAWLEVQRMHLTAIDHAIAENNNWILVLEDDSIIKAEAFSKIERIIQSTKAQNTWINLNSGAGLKPSPSDRPNKNGVFRVRPPATRCAVAYLISRDVGVNFVNEAKTKGIPNWLPIDFYFQVLLRKYKVRSYWTEPSLIDQGSETGNYESGFENYRV